MPIRDLRILNGISLAQCACMNLNLKTTYTFFVTVWMLGCVHKFRVYWVKHTAQWNAANQLLQSDVCMDPDLRIKLGEFDQCHRAERAIAFSPVQTALFAIGEDMHICGHNRCELLYVDITDRLTLILCITALIILLTTLKTYRSIRRDMVLNQTQQWSLPIKSKTI